MPTVAEQIETLIRQPRWAVVGATPRPDRAAFDILRLLGERGFTVFPVSPRYPEILGQKVYPSIEALPETPDVINLVVNPEAGLEAMHQAAARGVKYALVQPGAESPEITDYAKANGIQLLEGCILMMLRARPKYRLGA